MFFFSLDIFSNSLRIQERAQFDKGTELHWGRGRGTPHRKTGMKDTAHTFLWEAKTYTGERGTLLMRQLGWEHRTSLKELLRI